MRKVTKNILLTFDYELSLGYRSGTVANCMIRPTDLIIELLSKYELKGIFFIDTTSIMRMLDESEKYPELKVDIEQIKTQLIRLHTEGHYVYHHIHPHWLDAVYLPEEKQWDLSNQDRFSVDALSNEETLELISKSKDILEDWICPTDKNYKSEGYRAGGLFIQPFSKFTAAFKKNEIKYDFSVLRGAQCSLSGASYDFSNAPKSPIYSFEDDVIRESRNGEFTEISIKLIENKGIHKILNSIWFRLFYKNDAFADGKSNNVVIENKDKQSFWSKFSNVETLSFELANPIKIRLYKQYIQRNTFTHFISHPKLIGPTNLEAMDELLKKLKSRYIIQSDFKLFLDS